MDWRQLWEISSTPDNVPIVGLIPLLIFYIYLAWKQAQDRVRGETSVDAHELRKLATAAGGDTEKAKTEYFQAAFSDAIAIYLLATFLDVDYYDLRERDYTLLAPAALAERLRLVQQLFPPNSGFEFHIFHRRKQ